MAAFGNESGIRAGIALITCAVALLATNAANAAEQAWPNSEELSSQICVWRPENNGVLNIRPVEFVIDGGPVLTLLGGQAGCGYVRAGKHMVRAQSRDPYDQNSRNPRAWMSFRITLDVPASSRRELFVCAEAAYSTYTGWAIRRPGEVCE